MAHPHANLRQHKVERSRVSSMTRGYAEGGVVGLTALRKAGVPVQRALGGKIEGAGVAARSDRVPRAKGGRVGKTTVNVIVQSGGEKPPMPMPMMPPPGPPPMPPPRPPMPAAPPPMAGPPGAPPIGPGGPPMPPPGIRSQGGRTYATGGAVKSGPGWVSSMKAVGPVDHIPGKNDAEGPYGKNINRGKPITYAKGGAVARACGGAAMKTGGPINAPAGKKGMGQKLPGGGRSGVGRLAKAHRAAAK